MVRMELPRAVLGLSLSICSAALLELAASFTLTSPSVSNGLLYECRDCRSQNPALYRMRELSALQCTGAQCEKRANNPGSSTLPTTDNRTGTRRIDG